MSRTSNASPLSIEQNKLKQRGMLRDAARKKEPILELRETRPIAYECALKVLRAMTKVAAPDEGPLVEEAIEKVRWELSPEEKVNYQEAEVGFEAAVRALEEARRDMQERRAWRRVGHPARQ